MKIRTITIARRAFVALTCLSGAALLAVIVLLIWAQFASYNWQLRRWNPATRTFTETTIAHRAGGLSIHRESTTALPIDNPSALLSSIGPTNRQFIHRSSPPTPRAGDPFLWFDHYRATPSIGINQNGLSDCWTLQLRHEILIAFFAILPMIWGIKCLWQSLERRAFDRRGFDVIAD